MLLDTMNPRLRKQAQQPMQQAPVFDLQTRKLLEQQRRQLLQMAAEIGRLLEAAPPSKTATEARVAVVKSRRAHGPVPSSVPTE
jgi:hypothetical protein